MNENEVILIGVRAKIRDPICKQLVQKARDLSVGYSGNLKIFSNHSKGWNHIEAKG